MAQEYRYICLRDILKKEKFPNLSFFKYSLSESEVESDYSSARAMEMPTPSPFAIANSSAQVGERSGLNSSMGDEEERKRISDKHLLYKNCNNSGTIYKEKRLAAAPIASLKSSKSGKPLIYQTYEGNDGAFVLHVWTLILISRFDDSEDEEEKQMKKEEEKEEEEEELYVDADKARGGVGRRGGTNK
ncbi:Hypothetical predicted protein [Olea europaea subsp. europaea]|uniref:Uncharacterized protein n=1 Tax=Olea europaea subsp. europaea TaxID=158383 RepID=A0A8S0QWY7_OLEEU|nr:Hypothetical predicted protein [Olea europaea subsp. europaea]